MANRLAAVGESVVMRGVSKTPSSPRLNALLEVWIGENGWTITRTSPVGVMCIMSYGVDWLLDEWQPGERGL